MNIQKLSFVIPAKDEEATISLLHSRIARVVESIGSPYEIIFIDDGSTDRTWLTMQGLADEFPNTVRAMRLRRNIGKARALALGFEHATGNIVFTLDADLQDDPNEIPRFLQKLSEGYDIVSGYKQTRHDPWHKVLPSRIFNRMVSRLNGVNLHDHNCGFKCYRAEVIKQVRLYGEMHRMVPCLASIEGFRSTEIVVLHHPRRYGQSKYGLKRFLRGFMDMLTVWFLKNYRDRPQHFFGGIALGLLITGVICTTGGLALRGYYNQAEITAMFGATLMSTAAVFFGLGLFAELYTSKRRGATDLAPVIEDSGDIKVDPEASATVIEDDKTGLPEVLIVDDNPVARTILSAFLRDEPLKVVVATHGRDALEKITRRTQVVLLDMHMPVMDGLACLQQLKLRHQEIPVIMVTEEQDVEKAVHAMRLGAFNYFVRPVEKEKMVKQVRLAIKAHEVAVSRIVAAY